jgi:cytochrome c biogenesis protein
MRESKTTVPAKDEGYFTILYNFFRSLKLTIFLLIFLAVLSIIGTVITQNATRDEYLQRYGVGLYEVLNFFNLFDMYHSWWFSAILLLLVINLIACSAQRFPGVWMQISRGSGLTGLEDAMLKTLPYVEKIQMKDLPRNKTEGELQASLKRRFGGGKRVESETMITFFSEKGRFSRLGVYIVHLSILIILIGGMIGSLFGFRGFINILEGETVDHIFLRGQEREVRKPIEFSVRCEEFNITYYDLQSREKRVKEYSSKLSILENGKEVLKQTIEVNHPLHYKGLAFYQASYGALNEVALGVQRKGQNEKTLLRISEGETLPVSSSNVFVRLLRYAPQVHNFGEGAQVAVLRANQVPRTFWVMKGAPPSEQQVIDGFALTFEGIDSREYTGLQVTRDPGVWVVWIGCGLMIFGFIISFFFSHRKVWVRIPKGKFEAAGQVIVLAGTASKNRVAFEKTFHRLAEEFRSGSSNSG